MRSRRINTSDCIPVLCLAFIVAAAAIIVSCVPNVAFARYESVSTTDQDLSLQPSAESVASGTWGTCPWEIDTKGTLRVHAGKGAESEFHSGSWGPWWQYRSSIEAIEFDSDVVFPSDCSYLFYDLSKLSRVDVSKCRTSSMTNTKSMFNGCLSLSSLDLSGWDVSGVTCMSYMFNRCASLSSLNLSGWNVSGVTSMAYMIASCASLPSLDLSSWNVSNVTDMSCMFSSCSSLTSLNLNTWDVSGVTNMCYMFSYCGKLSSLDISGWKTSSRTGSFSTNSNDDGMCGMFELCSSLSTLDLSDWDVSGVAEMSSMFQGCSNLTLLDVSGWNTSNVTSASSMFTDCHPDVIKVGASYVISSDTFPQARSGMNWVSASTGEQYTQEEIVEFRGGIADEYEQGVDPTDVTAFSVRLSDSSLTYDGTEKRPSVSVFHEEKNLREGLDYTVAYFDNVNVGTARVMIFGIDGYTGSQTVTFRIVPANLAEASLRLSQSSYAYDGTPKTPAVTVVLGDKFLASGTDYTVAYSNNTNPGTAKVTVTGKENYWGSLSTTFEVRKPVVRAEMYRLYNPYSGEHFYTASTYERDTLSSIGWNYEGIGWVAPERSNSPVYRLYNPYAGDHHYTTSAGERDALKAVGWNDEGVGWYSDDAKSVPLYRQYNPYATVGTHNYTTSKGENDMLVSIGWQAEGIGWYGMK